MSMEKAEDGQDRDRQDGQGQGRTLDARLAPGHAAPQPERQPQRDESRE